jgi:hypothetical protein
MAGRMVNNELAVTWKEAVFAWSRYYLKICLRKKENAENLGQYVRSPDVHLNQKPEFIQKH